jgi:hypothetical protein
MKKMSGLSTVGGLLALIGGLFILVETFMLWSVLWFGPAQALIINLGIGGCGLIGGVFGMKAQRGAGVLALIVGLLSITLGIIFVYVTLATNLTFWQLSLFTNTMNIGILYINIFAGISIEAILITIGGILVIAGGGKE